MSTTIAWLIIAVILFMFEAITVGLVCIWFGIGALGSFIVSFATDNIILQLIVFVIITAVSFIIIKPLFKKIMPEKSNTNNTNRLVGKTAKVIEEISFEKGRVLIGDVSWLAQSNDQNVIEKDSLVKIIDTNSNTLIVKKINKEMNL